MDATTGDQVEYLCWYEGFTNCRAERIKASSPQEAAAQYRVLQPEHSGKMWVYCRADGCGPLFGSLS
jgi:hypothetical protein